MSGSLLMLALVLLVFSGYFTGRTIAPWDFLSGANHAYAWWDIGSFLHPPDYLPYAIGGSPAALNIQESAWYLPVGLPAELTSFTPRVAAVVQGLTVWLGCVGVMQLLRHWGISTRVALVCASAFVFTPGFISMAEHPSYVISWAFLPWLLLLLSPRSAPRWWLPLAATFVWFQFLVGGYPGTIVSFAYLFAVFVAVLLIRNRRVDWNYVLYALAPAVAGALLSALKWVPYALTSEGSAASGNVVVTDLGSVATLLFPYSSPSLSNDISMRSWFVVPVLLLAVCFIRRISPIVVLGLGLIGVSGFLGISIGSDRGWQSVLPLLDFSRFRAVDFKIGIILGVFLLAAAGLESIIRLKPEPADSRFAVRRGLVALVAVGVVVLCASVAPLTQENRRRGLVWVIVSGLVLLVVLVVLTIDRTTSRPLLVQMVLGAIGLVAVAVGFIWASDASYMWTVPRVEAEQLTWRATASALIDRQLPAVLPARPARSAPDFPANPDLLKDAYWSRGSFSRTPSIGGYTNLRGQPIYEELLAAAPRVENVPIFTLLDRASGAWVVDQAASTKNSTDLASCVLDESCVQPGSSATTKRWEPARILLQVSATGPGSLVINELGWSGWQAKLCKADGSCDVTTSTPSSGSLFLMVPISADTASVEFTYQTAGLKAAWVMFVLGVIFAFAAAWVLRRQTIGSPSSE
ncbi:MAG: hypothetical protein WCP28_16325 [Actinomycetes bacterium]